VRAPIIAAALVGAIAVLYLATARNRAEAVAKFAEEH
jgi:hypothetical protein